MQTYKKNIAQMQIKLLTANDLPLVSTGRKKDAIAATSAEPAYSTIVA